jgi:gas vesicle protein
MTDNENDRGGSALKAALIGAVVGAAAVILSNPDSRKKVKDKLSEWMEKGQDKLEQAQEKAGDLKDEGKRKVARGLEKARRKLEEDNNQELSKEEE